MSTNYIDVNQNSYPRIFNKWSKKSYYCNKHTVCTLSSGT